MGFDSKDNCRSQECQVPVIFITSVDDESVRIQALNAGAVCFLTKPFEVRTLITHLEEALKRRPIALATAFGQAGRKREQEWPAGCTNRSEVSN